VDDADDADIEPELITEFSDEQDEGSIQAAEQEVRFLRTKVFCERTIGLMTSRLKPAEKRQVMDDFRAGRIDILVSTTVVEVGVDVPNATVMVIEDADRFGLSQLHQLRGRVGRGERDGEVFLVSGTHSEDARKRLAIMERSSDGFELAEYDLRLRREGDILGSRQHGIATLRLVNVVRDAELIQKAHTEAQALLAQDPLLEAFEHRHLAYELAVLFGEGRP
jgi:ATP-dependent DNA helicase RecG